MKCPKCKNKVSPDELNCPYCGARIGEEIIERLLPLLRKPLEKPATPLSVHHRLFTGMIKPNVVFSDIVSSPDLLGPLLVVFLNSFLSTIYFLLPIGKIFFTDMLFFLFFKDSLSSLPIILFYFNLSLAFLELFLVSFLYWLPLKLLGRDVRFKSFVSMVGYAYVLVVLGQMVSLIITSINSSVLVMPALPPVLQLSTTQFYLYLLWKVGKTAKLVCLLGVAFLITPGIRKAAKLSTSFSLIFSYSVVLIAYTLLTF
ncbi:MAG: zinc ribbon domain-containing protein [Candidatus Jordarchaeales archaeon]